MLQNKQVGRKIGAIIPAIAMHIGVASTRQACVAIFYQPVMPASMKKVKTR